MICFKSFRQSIYENERKDTKMNAKRECTNELKVFLAMMKNIYSTTKSRHPVCYNSMSQQSV